MSDPDSMPVTYNRLVVNGRLVISSKDGRNVCTIIAKRTGDPVIEGYKIHVTFNIPPPRAIRLAAAQFCSHRDGDAYVSRRVTERSRINDKKSHMYRGVTAILQALRAQGWRPE